MPYTISMTSAFEVSNATPNASDRAFAMDVHGFSIDSAFLGNASDLMFNKDLRLFEISGGISTQERPYLVKTAAFQITGRIRGELVTAHQQAAFIIEGTGAPVAAKKIDSFIIDNVPQETPP